MIHATSIPARTLAGLYALLAVLCFAGGCAMRESSTDPDGNAGVVVNVQDSSNVILSFLDTSKILFTDSGFFDLDEIRAKMSDKGLDPDDVNITGIIVTYDDSTKAFIAANQGVKFVLKVYIRAEGTRARKLAMETLENDIGEFKALAFDPAKTVLALGKDIFSNPEGFPDLLNAIKNPALHSAWLIAEMKVPGKLKAKGNMRINMVVTVAGKV